MDKLTLRYDPLTIKHLGVSLYSQLPSVLSELISNAYDADADVMEINLVDNLSGKEIYIKDNGHGMSFDEINDKYLMVGRNRRVEVESRFTPIKKRLVIGKKGLGKLSVFGVCSEILIKTIKDGYINEFEMNLIEIERLKGEYNPPIIKKNESTALPNGTELTLKKVKRKGSFDLDLIVKSLSKKFTVFDELKVNVSLNNKNLTQLTNEMKFSELKMQYDWEFPNDMFGTTYPYWNRIKGTIITPETPLKDTSMRGIYLTSRGKIVNEAEFYGIRDNDFVHTYMTGYLEIDFIDEFEEDVISTDRHSLIWEHDEATALKSYLQDVIKKIGVEWKKNRNRDASEDIKKHSGIDVLEWKKGLVPYERKLAEQIVDPILEDPSIDIKNSTQMVQGVINQFSHQSFKDYASELANTVPSQEIPRIINLLNNWKITETKELSALATMRVEVINTFEKLLEDDTTKEVPTLHDFLKKFSWLLDPRVLEFKDEVTYSKLLKETYPEEDLKEDDKRIDFLCSNTMGGILYVIEIKRSNYKIDKKAIEQAYEYGVFLKDKYATESGFSNVVCYVVGGSKSTEGVFQSKEKTYMRTGEVFVKTYRELLEQSKKFHSEFIQTHKSFNSN
ncbi:MAG: ATP-binding protein [Methylotenera sp.]|uniref:ATP-binding protein n=1 Tax=Methylotenera sp. TaxID=2051956 RepID=UPI00271BB22E|nr:ATP-binding protein [Methylotenera sp.]MDO9150585.1 ATP-binding protein [Methylotenera sp.]